MHLKIDGRNIDGSGRLFQRVLNTWVHACTWGVQSTTSVNEETHLLTNFHVSFGIHLVPKL